MWAVRFAAAHDYEHLKNKNKNKKFVKKVES